MGSAQKPYGPVRGAGRLPSGPAGQHGWTPGSSRRRDNCTTTGAKTRPAATVSHGGKHRKTRAGLRAERYGPSGRSAPGLIVTRWRRRALAAVPRLYGAIKTELFRSTAQAGACHCTTCTVRLVRFVFTFLITGADENERETTYAPPWQAGRAQLHEAGGTSNQPSRRRPPQGAVPSPGPRARPRTAVLNTIRARARPSRDHEPGRTAAMTSTCGPLRDNRHTPTRPPAAAAPKRYTASKACSQKRTSPTA